MCIHNQWNDMASDAKQHATAGNGSFEQVHAPTDDEEQKLLQ